MHQRTLDRWCIDAPAPFDICVLQAPLDCVFLGSSSIIASIATTTPSEHFDRAYYLAVPPCLPRVFISRSCDVVPTVTVTCARVRWRSVVPRALAATQSAPSERGAHASARKNQTGACATARAEERGGRGRGAMQRGSLCCLSAAASARQHTRITTLSRDCAITACNSCSWIVRRALPQIAPPPSPLALRHGASLPPPAFSCVRSRPPRTAAGDPPASALCQCAARHRW
jgi:hypothetical protein